MGFRPERGNEVRFIADTMLGKLAKWLRVMGYDTQYRAFYEAGCLARFVRGGYILLSRHRSILDNYHESLFIRSDTVKDQLLEMKKQGYLTMDKSAWFSRCLVCNLPLQEIARENVRDKIPEYVFHRNRTGIRFCLSCGRYFWPGSHREKMVRQLEAWGIKQA